jgi:hypothetical protein
METPLLQKRQIENLEVACNVIGFKFGYEFSIHYLQLIMSIGSRVEENNEKLYVHQMPRDVDMVGMD